jgi:PAS domain S-box-containing protein
MVYRVVRSVAGAGGAKPGIPNGPSARAAEHEPWSVELAGLAQPADDRAPAAFIGGPLLCGLGVGLRRWRWGNSVSHAPMPRLDLFDFANASLRDLDDHVLRWSDGCARLYGFEPREAEGHVCHELLRTRFPCPPGHIRRALLEQGRWEGELRHRRSDGSEVIVASTWRLGGKRAGPAVVVVVDTDVTQHRRFAELLTASQERRRILMETTLQGIMEQDRDGRIVAVNPAAERILGRSAAELVGRTPMDQDWHMLREDHTPLPGHEHPGLLALKTRQSINNALVGVWNPRVRAYRWLSMNAVPLRRPGNSGTFEVYTVFADVTDGQQADAAAQRAAQRHETALDAAIMGTWDYHPASGSMFWDQRCRSIFGVGFGDRVEFKTIMALVHEEDRPRVEAEFQRALDAASSGAYESEYRVVWPDGSIHWVNVIGQAYFKGIGGQRHAVRFIGTTLDITERKRLEEERNALLSSERAARTEAERANRLKDEFVATLSHELRNPLNVILGWVQILERSKRLPADANEAVQVIHSSGRVLADLISQLLDMSRITSGKLLLDMQTIDMAAVIRAALETAKPAIEAKDIRLETALDAAAGQAHGDPNRLKQVIWNLLSNAVKFTGRGGVIRVETARSDARLDIRVSDTGQGIDPEFIPHIFERFRQEDASAARKHGGLGLGLSIAHSLVEMHGGSIKVTSPGKGRGTTFTVSLPMLQAPKGNGQAAAALAETTTEQRGGHAEITLEGVRLLVVDDDRGSLQIVKRMLEERHATVFTAASARQGLELLQRVRPDVLISDIGMPEEDGYRFLRRVRALDPHHGGSTPAMALTAFASPEDRRRAMLCGYQAHLTKPIEASRLIAIVAGLASRTGEQSLG